MKEFAKTVNLKNDQELIRQYKEYHAQAWPEIVRSFKAVGVLDMKIFISGRRLFMYMTTTDDFDPKTSIPAYLELHPKCREWEKLMETYQERVPESHSSEMWTEMEKIFQL